MSHDHPSLLEDQPELPLTSEDWTHDTINIGLPAIIPSGVVACVPARGVTRSVKFMCVQCDVALCVDRDCFVDYHTKDKL